MELLIDLKYCNEIEKINVLKGLLRECICRFDRDKPAYSSEDIMSFSDYLHGRNVILANATPITRDQASLNSYAIGGQLNVLLSISDLETDDWRGFAFEAAWNCFIFEVMNKVRIRGFSRIITDVANLYLG